MLIREGNVLEFADPRLKGEYSVDAFDLCLKLALWRVEGDFAGISDWHTTYSTGWLSPG